MFLREAGTHGAIFSGYHRESRPDVAYRPLQLLVLDPVCLFPEIQDFLGVPLRPCVEEFLMVAREQSFDLFDDLAGLGLGAGGEAEGALAVARDQILVEIPFRSIAVIR